MNIRCIIEPGIGMGINLLNKLLKKGFISLFAIYSLSFVFLLAIAIIVSYSLTLSVVEKDAKTNEEISALMLNQDIVNILDQIRSDVTFLTNQTEYHYIIEKQNFKQHIEETFYQFSVSKKIYNQIRFIDKSGMELIRINNTRDSTYIVSEKDFQDKSGRYYFNDIFNLQKGSVYFSVFDLNIENGKIEIPFNPMIRIGSPVFNSDKEKVGILIVNYIGEHLLNLLKEENELSQGSLFLFNNDGYYFLGPKPEDEWGFMFEDKKDRTFFNHFQNASETIFNQQSGSFINEKGLFVFSTINPLSQIATNKQNQFPEQCFWKIVSFIPAKQLNERAFELLEPRLKTIFPFTILIFILLWYLARNIHQKKQARQNLVLKNQELDEMVKAKDKFFSIIAHDLKSPFNSLLGFSEMLNYNVEQISEEDLKSITESLYTTSKNTYNLLENLLEWSRMHTGKINPKPEEYIIDESLKEIEELMRENAHNKNIDFNIEVNSGASVYADKEMIKTVLRNLVSNAIKFTPTGGKISVSVNSKADFIEFKVSDSGVGMSQQDIDQLFNSGHVESKHGTENEKGTGLGLMLCKEFIEKNEGTLRIESIIGKGSNFYVCVPAEV